MNAPAPPPTRRTRKLPARFTPLVFSFYMASIMALLMSSVIVALNTGVSDGYISRVLHSYVVAMPVAFCCVLLVRPLVAWLVSKTVEMPSR